MINRVLLLLVLLFPFAPTVVAQETRAQKFRVNVIVSPQKTGLSHEAESYIKRELRSLGDVEVTDKDPGFTIQAIVMEVIGSTKGSTLGVAISWVTLIHSTRRVDPQKDIVGFMDSQLYNSAIVDHQLWTGDNDSLRRLCQEYIANFDTTILEISRTK